MSIKPNLSVVYSRILSSVQRTILSGNEYSSSSLFFLSFLFVFVVISFTNKDDTDANTHDSEYDILDDDKNYEDDSDYVT